MSISKIKREYKIKNLFSLLIIFVLLVVVSLVSRSFKNDSTSKSESLFSIAQADIPYACGTCEGGGGCGSDGGCGGSSSSGGDGG